MTTISKNWIHCVAGTLFVALAATAAGQSSQSAPSCEPVSGSISTNFIDPATTLGTATGDMQGGVSAVVLAVAPGANGRLTFTVVHRFITTSGDLIVSRPSAGIAVPSAEDGVTSLTFANMELEGKSGRFEGATGTLKLFGGANLQSGEVVVRYRGQICFAAKNKS